LKARGAVYNLQNRDESPRNKNFFYREINPKKRLLLLLFFEIDGLGIDDGNNKRVR
jgi:hypothetical protein